METIRSSVVVDLPPDEAFSAFVERFDEWWPQAYTFSKESLQTIGIEAREGGFCYEIGPFGFRCDWGRVLEWSPPSKLRFAWHISPNSAPDPDPEHASKVYVTFSPKEGNQNQTLVELEHSAIERHGEGGAQYREELASEYGWPYLLSAFQQRARAA